MGFPGGASGKDPAYKRRRHQRLGFNPWMAKIPWRREGMATHSSLLACRIPMDRGAWRAKVHRSTKSGTWLKWLSMQANRSTCFTGSHLLRAQHLIGGDWRPGARDAHQEECSGITKAWTASFNVSDPCLLTTPGLFLFKVHFCLWNFIPKHLPSLFSSWGYIIHSVGQCSNWSEQGCLQEKKWNF